MSDNIRGRKLKVRKLPEISNSNLSKGRISSASSRNSNKSSRDKSILKMS